MDSQSLDFVPIDQVHDLSEKNNCKNTKRKTDYTNNFNKTKWTIPFNEWWTNWAHNVLN